MGAKRPKEYRFQKARGSHANRLQFLQQRAPAVNTLWRSGSEETALTLSGCGAGSVLISQGCIQIITESSVTPFSNSEGGESCNALSIVHKARRLRSWRKGANQWVSCAPLLASTARNN